MQISADAEVVPAGKAITTYQSLKRTVYRIMEEDADGNSTARYFNYCMIFLIVLNVAIVILETVPWLYAQYFWIFTSIDVISFAAFTAEYILRIWVCTTNPLFKNPLTGRIRYALTPFALVDLLAIAPFYLPLVFPVDLRFLRIIRLFRIIRVLKLGRYSDAVRTFGRVINRKKEQLIIILSILIFAIIIASTLMYYAEHDAQPVLFASIPNAMWWALVTLATVGSGEMHPVTALGKVIGGIVLIVGIALLALPTAVLAAGFFEESEKEIITERNRQEEVVCPACGHHFSPGEDEEKAPTPTRTEVFWPPEK
nr:ion transporter [uncultured Methanoregula sp.]